MTDPVVQEILDTLAQLSPEQRLFVFRNLRNEFEIHGLESEFGIAAEIILEAISRASDLTKRGVRGVIAEAVFVSSVVEPLVRSGWKETQAIGDWPFDFDLSDDTGHARVQVKLQRKEAGKAKQTDGLYVVETQRTRGGKKKTNTLAGGEVGVSLLEAKSRPYRFGEFDILAVCMHPSTNRWADFMYTVESWLVPSGKDSTAIETFQYIPPAPNADWTDDFLTAVKWWRSNTKKKIAGKPQKQISLLRAEFARET